jgi:hypothetical protein
LANEVTGNFKSDELALRCKANGKLVTVNRSDHALLANSDVNGDHQKFSIKRHKVRNRFV